jgi:uncharacterized protein (TIGR02449 family)
MSTSSLETPNLELQINDLVESYQRLLLENTSLRKKNLSLGKELAAAATKKERAVEVLKKLITQFKDELSCLPK